MSQKEIANGSRLLTAFGAVLLMVLTGQSASAQSVTAVNLPSVTLQSGQSATLTMFGSGLARIAVLQVVSGGDVVVGVSATLVGNGATQRRFTLSASPSAVAGQVQVRGRTAAGVFVSIPVAVTIQEAPTDAAITISTLALSVDSAYTGTGLSAAVTLSAPPLAALAVDVVNAGTGAVVASGAVPAGSVSTTIPVTAQGTGLVKYRARRPPYATGPMDSLFVFALPQVSSLSFVGPLKAGVANTLNVAISPVAKLGGVLQLTSSSGVLIVPSSVPLTADQSMASIPVGVANTTQNISGTVTATVGTSKKSRSFDVLGSAPTPGIASIAPVALSVTGGNEVTFSVALNAAVSGGATIKVTPVNPALLATAASVALANGATSAQVTATTSPVLAATTTQLLLELGTSSATANVTINPPKPSAVTFTGPYVAGAPVSASVTLDGIVASAPGVVVTLTSNGAWASPPTSVTVAPGAFTQTFNIPTAAAFATSTRSVSIGASTAQGNSSGSFSLVRETGVVSAVSVSPNTVDGSEASTGTVTLDMPSKAGGTVVQLTSANSWATVPSTLTVAEGQTSQTFAIATPTVTSNTSVAISANDGVQTKSATLTVQPLLALTGLQANAAVEGGEALTMQATFNRPVASGSTATVALTSSSPALVFNAPATLVCCRVSTSFAASTTPVVQDAVAVVSATHGGVTKLDTVLVRAPATLQSVTLSPASIYTQQTSTAMVSLNRVATVPVAISLSSSDPAKLTVPPTATITVGQSSVSVPVSATAGGNYMVNAAITGSTASGELTVEVWDAVFTISVPGLPGKDTLTANQSYPASISMAGRAGPVALTVSMGAQPTGILTMPTSVTVPAGSRNAPFTLSTGAVNVPTLVTMTASGGGFTTTRTFVVRPL